MNYVSVKKKDPLIFAQFYSYLFWKFDIFIQVFSVFCDVWKPQKHILTSITGLNPIFEKQFLSPKK